MQVAAIVRFTPFVRTLWFGLQTNCGCSLTFVNPIALKGTPCRYVITAVVLYPDIDSQCLTHSKCEAPAVSCGPPTSLVM